MEVSVRKHSIPIEILDDLASRFIINLPEPMRKDLIRICFQLETAHWFYSDEYQLASNSRLQNCTMKQFAEHMFRHIPFLRKYVDQVDQIIEDWRQYKISVPTYGAIMLNEDLSKVVLVQSYWNKTSWGFPKGKVNEEEPPHLCAVREVLEETGYNIGDAIDPDTYSEQVLNEQLSRLYFVPGVPLNTEFCPKTKFEIRSIQWFPIDLLPSSKKDPIPDGLGLTHNGLYMVMPFVRAIRKWIATQRRKTDHRRRSTQPNAPQVQHQVQRQKSISKEAPFGSMDFMPKAWQNFSVKKKDLFQAMDSVLRE